MKLKILASLAILLAAGSLSRADIIGNTLRDDGDGVFSCYTYDFLQIGPQAYSLTIDGTQMRAEPGHILGDILTDGTDPALTLAHVIDNDTPFAWTDYHLVVTLNKPFTLSNIIVSNPGWTWALTAPAIVGADWIGQIDYFAGTPVPVNGLLSFSYTLTFDGSVSFAEQLTPSYIPEPGSLAIAVCGLLGLVGLRRRSA